MRRRTVGRQVVESQGVGAYRDESGRRAIASFRMPSNDAIILEKILEVRYAEIGTGLDAPTFFELFVAEQVLKDFDLSYDELRAGRVGGGGNGGIDAIYLFANGDLVQEDSDLSSLKRQVAIDLVIVQAKAQPGFSEGALDKLQAVTADLLNLSADHQALASVYNAELLSSMIRFKEAYEALAARFPKLRIAYYYATKGDQPHPNVERKVGKLRELVAQRFSASEFSFQFLGAKELLERARQAPRVAHLLKLSENPISSTGAVGFVCLVKLRDFFDFITDEKGTLRRGIFEANVRDYQGTNEVNEGIQGSLRDARRDEFWWLNNGVTILASQATLSGKTLTIEDPQIVNGLQTSTEMFNYFSASNTLGDERSLLVRVVVPAAPESRDRIIKATNSQTPMPVASLRATEKIHRDIEEYLRPFGLFYDRRKNYFKNEGKPIEKIISISQMAQSVMAIALQRPNSARGRPSSLLKRDEDYATVFNQEYPIGLYLLCPLVMKRVENVLRVDDRLDLKDRNNVRFHMAMVAAALVSHNEAPSPSQVAALQIDGFTDAILQEALGIAVDRYRSLGATDQVSKGPELVEDLKMDVAGRMRPSPGAAPSNEPPVRRGT